MTVLSVNQASANLAKFLERVEAGEEIMIALGLGPPTKLRALSRRSRKRRPGERSRLGYVRPPKEIGKPAARLVPPLFER